MATESAETSWVSDYLSKEIKGKEITSLHENVLFELFIAESLQMVVAFDQDGQQIWGSHLNLSRLKGPLRAKPFFSP